MKQFRIAAASLATLFMASTNAHATTNEFDNPNFDNSLWGWNINVVNPQEDKIAWVENGGDGMNSSARFYSDVNENPAWNMQLAQRKSVSAGDVYNVQFDVATTSQFDRNVTLYIQQDGGTWELYAEQSCWVPGNGVAHCELTGSTPYSENVNFGIKGADNLWDFTVDNAKLYRVSNENGNPSKLKWAYEDRNGNGAWEYSWINFNFTYVPGGTVGDLFTDLPLTQSAYEGATALHLEFLNLTVPADWGFVEIASSTDKSGREPSSNTDANTGKDLSSYKNLEFFIRGELVNGLYGCNQSDLNVLLNPTNHNGGTLVPLKNYVTINDQWQKVVVPMAELIPTDPAYIGPAKFDIKKIQFVGFFMGQSSFNVACTFDVDNIAFTK